VAGAAIVLVETLWLLESAAGIGAEGAVSAAVSVVTTSAASLSPAL
jgi:hypothetical protein